MNTELIKFLIILGQILFILRFHMEISQINAFIEPVNTIRKITNPLVMPMKRLIPWPWAKKFAAIKVAYLVGFLILLIAGSGNIASLLLQALLWLLVSWMKFIQYGVFIYVIGSWIQIPAFQRNYHLLHALFEPLLAPIRRILPSFGGIDLSPMVLLIGLSMLSGLIF